MPQIYLYFRLFIGIKNPSENSAIILAFYLSLKLYTNSKIVPAFQATKTYPKIKDNSGFLSLKPHTNTTVVPASTIIHYTTNSTIAPAFQETKTYPKINDNSGFLSLKSCNKSIYNSGCSSA